MRQLIYKTVDTIYFYKRPYVEANFLENVAVFTSFVLLTELENLKTFVETTFFKNDLNDLVGNNGLLLF